MRNIFSNAPIRRMVAGILRRLTPMERVCGAILVSRKWDGLDYVAPAPNSALTMSRRRMRASGEIGAGSTKRAKGMKCA